MNLDDLIARAAAEAVLTAQPAPVPTAKPAPVTQRKYRTIKTVHRNAETQRIDFVTEEVQEIVPPAPCEPGCFWQRMARKRSPEAVAKIAELDRAQRVREDIARRERVERRSEPADEPLDTEDALDVAPPERRKRLSVEETAALRKRPSHG